jgi:predicted HTH domain antitoxin
MEVTLPADLEAKVRPEELRLDLAVGMYAARRVTLGRAAEVAGLTQLDFQRELGRRKVPLHYDLEDWAVDVQAVRELSGNDDRRQ